MILKPVTCRHNSKVLCGVVKNTKNCPYQSEGDCRGNNATNLLGIVNNAFGTVVLKEYRYNTQMIRTSVLEKNLCEKCKVLWSNPEDNCLICGRGE